MKINTYYYCTLKTINMESLTSRQQNLISEIMCDKNKLNFVSIVNPIWEGDFRAICPFIKSKFKEVVRTTFGSQVCETPILHKLTTRHIKILLELNILDDNSILSPISHVLLTDSMRSKNKTFIKNVLNIDIYYYHNRNIDSVYIPPYDYLIFLKYPRVFSKEDFINEEFSNEDLDIIRFVYRNLPSRKDKEAFLDDIKYFYDNHKNNAVLKLHEELITEYDGMLLVKAARN